jgi:hypothetical protein
MKTLENLFQSNGGQKCIINTDLDGIFTGLLLHNYLNWEIIGFCDSKESILFDRNRCNSIDEAVFIDMFVFPENIKCIDQHIISIDDEHNSKLSANPNKLNPNLLNKRNFLPNESYYLKYPFGTIHFVMACLERIGITMEMNFFKEVSLNISVIDLLLRADDAFNTSTFSRYRENAEQWWKWLLEFSKNGESISIMHKYIEYYKLNYDEKTYSKLKKEIGKLLRERPFLCDSPDGGFKGKKSLGKHFLKPNVKNYIQFIAENSGLKCFNLDFSFSLLTGKSKRCSLNNGQKEQLKSGNFNKDLFSYAFVRTQNRSDNFSYTLLER